MCGGTRHPPRFPYLRQHAPEQRKHHGAGLQVQIARLQVIQLKAVLPNLTAEPRNAHRIVHGDCVTCRLAPRYLLPPPPPPPLPPPPPPPLPPPPLPLPLLLLLLKECWDHLSLAILPHYVVLWWAAPHSFMVNGQIETGLLRPN